MPDSNSVGAAKRSALCAEVGYDGSCPHCIATVPSPGASVGAEPLGDEQKWSDRVDSLFAETTSLRAQLAESERQWKTENMLRVQDATARMDAEAEVQRLRGVADAAKAWKEADDEWAEGGVTIPAFAPDSNSVGAEPLTTEEQDIAHRPTHYFQATFGGPLFPWPPEIDRRHCEWVEGCHWVTGGGVVTNGRPLVRTLCARCPHLAEARVVGYLVDVPYVAGPGHQDGPRAERGHVHQPPRVVGGVRGGSGASVGSAE